MVMIRCCGASAYAMPPSQAADLEVSQLEAQFRAPASTSVVAKRAGDPKPKPWIVRHWTVPVIAATLVIAYFTLRGHLPSLDSVADAFSRANVWWLTVAVVIETVSNVAFAFQQRALLKPLGVRMSLPRAIGVTYARSALALSMPAGSAVSAGYALREYKRSGASTEKATAVTLISGVISVLGLGALYVFGVVYVVLANPITMWHEHPILIAAGVAVTVAAVGAWWRSRRTRSARPGTSVVLRSESHPPRRFESIRVAIRQALDAWRTLGVRDWSVSGAWAVVNWLADLLCLAAAARAFDLQVGLVTLASIYLGVQLVRQIPVTPGGIGLVEAGLLAGLVSAGGGAAEAAAVVLTYRVLSCWSLLPLGGLAWLGMRTGSRRSAANDYTGQLERGSQLDPAGLLERGGQLDPAGLLESVGEIESADLAA
ncbi:MAG TPA: YbhN family protein [Micromonosporaceae bacterium]